MALDESSAYASTSTAAPRALLGAILFGGVALRLLALGNHSIWYDEGATLSLSTAADPIAALDTSRHPPVAILALNGWIRVFGESTATIRLLTALISCGSLFCFARLARLWLAPAGATLALALYAVAPFQNWYAQEITPYAFLELGTLLTLASLASAMDRPVARALEYAGIFAGVALSFGSQYLGFAVGVSAGAIACLSIALGRIPVKRALGWIAAAIAGGLVWIPWILTKVPRQMHANPGYDAKTSPRELAELPVRLLVIDTSVMPEGLHWAGYLLGGVLWIGLIAFVGRAILRRRAFDVYILTALLMPAVSILALTFIIPPILLPRYLMAAVPAVALAVAGGLTWIRPRPLALVLSTVAALGLASLTIAQKLENRREDFRTACAEIVSGWKPGDRVYVVTGNPDALAEGSLRHYFRDRSDIRDSMGHTSVDAPLLSTAIPAGTRIHVVFRKKWYAMAHMGAFRNECELADSSPERFGIQRFLFVKR